MDLFTKRVFKGLILSLSLISLSMMDGDQGSTSISFLYWTPSQEGLIASYHSSPHEGYEYTKYPSAPPKGGFKVRLDALINPYDWILSAEYTWLGSHGKEHTKLTRDSFPNEPMDLVTEDVTSLRIAENPNGVPKETKSSDTMTRGLSLVESNNYTGSYTRPFWDDIFQQARLSLDRCLCLGKRATLGFSMGLLSSWDDQTFNLSRLFVFGDYPTDNTTVFPNTDNSMMDTPNFMLTDDPIGLLRVFSYACYDKGWTRGSSATGQAQRNRRDYRARMIAYESNTALMLVNHCISQFWWSVGPACDVTISYDLYAHCKEKYGMFIKGGSALAWGNVNVTAETDFESEKVFTFKQYNNVKEDATSDTEQAPVDYQQQGTTPTPPEEDTPKESVCMKSMDDPVIKAYTITDKRGSLWCMVESQIGLRWDAMVGSSCLSLIASWEQQVWFAQNHMVEHLPPMEEDLHTVRPYELDMKRDGEAGTTVPLQTIYFTSSLGNFTLGGFTLTGSCTF